MSDNTSRFRPRYVCERCDGTGSIDADGEPDGIFSCDMCGGIGWDYRSLGACHPAYYTHLRQGR